MDSRQSTECSPTATVTAPYAGFGKQLILRDRLAIDRTRLSNERTLLAWLRTALMTLVSGITMIKLFEGVVSMEVLGGVLIPLSLVGAVWGTHRYLHTRASIASTLGE